MSALPISTRPSNSHLGSNTPPTPSRTPSNASTADAGNDEESADDSDFLEPDPDDPDASTASLSRLGPAVATPKPTSTPWPFNVPTSAMGAVFPGTFPDGLATNGSHARSTFDDETTVAPPAPIPASSLPHEILLHILRLLPTTALAPALRVCKAWCQCGVELLWHKPMFTSLSALYRMLQILSLPDQTFPYPEFVRRLNFSNLTDEMSDKMLSKLLPCTKIERLTLTGCKHLSSEAMVTLLKQSKRLVALDLSEVENVDDSVVEALAENCPRLQGLNLTGCSKVTDRGIEALALGCPALRRIKLRKCDIVTDVSIVLLSLHCPLLLEVDLGACISITSLALQQLLRTSHNLRELSLTGCSSLGDDGFPDASAIFSLSSASASAYSSAQASPALSSSDDCPPSPGANPLSAPSGRLVRRPLALRSPPSLKPFDHLRYLDLTSLSNLTDAAVAGIVKHMPKVRNLILAKCTRLTDESLYSVCAVGKHLHYLHLGHVAAITDKAVTAVARSCTRLRYIDLACCNNLTDMSVFELAANLPRLKRIGLVRVTNITDEALYSLFSRTSLERIHLSYCDNLTVGAVHELLQHLPRLTHLSLTGVSAFRKKALQVFCRPPPKDFNDHQRRSFCVFSGRGVQELRKYLRTLSPPELAALAIPDPPSDDELARAAAGIGGHGGGGAGAAPGAGAGANANAQLAAARARLAQLAQARQAVAAAIATRTPLRGGTAGVTAGGAGAGAGGAHLGPALNLPPTSAPPPAQRTDSQQAVQQWRQTQQQQQQQQQRNGPAAPPPPPSLPGAFPPPPANALGLQQPHQPHPQQERLPFPSPDSSPGPARSLQEITAGQMPDQYDRNGVEHVHAMRQAQNERQRNSMIPIQRVASTNNANAHPSSSMDVDMDLDDSTRPGSRSTTTRARGATVTRHNYRGGHDEAEESGSDLGEEDLTMTDV
ncbi:SPOSA6832_00848, partial [Sporobolomyces salmonicolor]